MTTDCLNSSRRWTDNAILEYDSDGNLIRRQLQDGRTWQYRYNAAGLLAEVVTPEGEEVRFTYDPFGRRIRKETSASAFEWIWDRDVPIHELRQGEASQETPIRTWLFEPEGFTPLAQLDGFVWYSVHADHLGTPQGLYDERGEAGWQGRLDLAGALEHEVQRKTRCPFRFPGQYADEETGLYYNRFRYYDPSLGSYITQDPIGLEGGLRAYGYVEDPLTWLDPWGLERYQNPFTVLFSQSSASPSFGDGRSVQDLAGRLSNSPSYAGEIPAIRLVRFRDLPESVQSRLRGQGVHEFAVFTLDNRRLVAARRAALRNPSVRVLTRFATAAELADINLERRFSTDTGGRSIQCG